MCIICMQLHYLPLQHLGSRMTNITFFLETAPMEVEHSLSCHSPHIEASIFSRFGFAGSIADTYYKF